MSPKLEIGFCCKYLSLWKKNSHLKLKKIFFPSHLLAKNIDAQNLREFVNLYAQHVMKNQDDEEPEKEPIISKAGSDSMIDVEK